MSAPNFKPNSTDVLTYSHSVGGTVPTLNTASYMVVKTSNTAPNAETGGAVATTYNFWATTSEHYEKIFSAQCVRVGADIEDQLGNLDRSDDDCDEVVVDYIARIIDLVGEPAFLTAAVEAKCRANDPSTLEPLLLALATAKHKQTEGMRLDFVKDFAERPEYKVRRAAVRALSRFNSAQSKSVLKQIGLSSEQSEIGKMASALGK